MSCQICDQKPANCDCTARERWQFAEIEDLRAENERLRDAIRRIADQNATVSVVSGNVIVEMDCDCQGLQQKNLTDEELLNLKIAINLLSEAGWGTSTLRSLLERLGGER